ncbi:hypothetical protein K502DRAFT_363897 [Neoconidiobolus thromboides FSU 785]|nr:hypothetical protein K502DRAFT_363897 [Neoconidiobolus thromboides FSU 785]
MTQFEIQFPETTSAKGFYLSIILLNALLSFRLPSSLQGLFLTCIVYALLLSGKSITKFLALLFSIIRVVLALSFTVNVSIWTILVTYSLSIMLCWILYKISVSIDNKQLLHLFNVRLMEPPSLFLRLLQHNSAHIIWEHPLDRYIDGYHVEVNNHIICRCDAHERAVSIPNLRPNCTYRIRIWAFSRTRGKAASLYISFHTPKEPLDGANNANYQSNEIPTEEDVKQLEHDLKVIQESRENIKTEMESLQKEEAMPSSIQEDIQKKKEEVAKLKEKLETVKKEREIICNEKDELKGKKLNQERLYDELNDTLKKLKNEMQSLQSKVETQKKFKLEQPKLIHQMEKKYCIDINKLRKECQSLEDEVKKIGKETEATIHQYEEKQGELNKKREEHQKLEKQIKESIEFQNRTQGISKEEIIKFLNQVSKLKQLEQNKTELNFRLEDLNSKKLQLLQSLASFNKVKNKDSIKNKKKEVYKVEKANETIDKKKHSMDDDSLNGYDHLFNEDNKKHSMDNDSLNGYDLLFNEDKKSAIESWPLATSLSANPTTSSNPFKEYHNQDYSQDPWSALLNPVARNQSKGLGRNVSTPPPGFSSKTIENRIDNSKFLNDTPWFNKRSFEINSKEDSTFDPFSEPLNPQPFSYQSSKPITSSISNQSFSPFNQSRSTQANTTQAYSPFQPSLTPQTSVTQSYSPFQTSLAPHTNGTRSYSPFETPLTTQATGISSYSLFPPPPGFKREVKEKNEASSWLDEFDFSTQMNTPIQKNTDTFTTSFDDVWGLNDFLKQSDSSSNNNEKDDSQ